jgi:hypothetical protein
MTWGLITNIRAKRITGTFFYIAAGYSFLIPLICCFLSAAYCQKPKPVFWEVWGIVYYALASSFWAGLASIIGVPISGYWKIVLLALPGMIISGVLWVFNYYIGCMMAFPGGC